jgi:hypothetical protein
LKNRNEQKHFLGDAGDLELFPLSMGPIAEIEILRTDHEGNIDTKTLSLQRAEKPVISTNPEPLISEEDDYSQIDEKSSKMEGPLVVKGEDSADSNKSIDRKNPIPPPRSVQESTSTPIPGVPPRTYRQPLVPVENIR